MGLKFEWVLRSRPCRIFSLFLSRRILCSWKRISCLSKRISSVEVLSRLPNFISSVKVCLVCRSSSRLSKFDLVCRSASRPSKRSRRCRSTFCRPVLTTASMCHPNTRQTHQKESQMSCSRSGIPSLIPRATVDSRLGTFP